MGVAARWYAATLAVGDVVQPGASAEVAVVVGAGN